MTGPVNGAPAVKVRNRSALLQDEAPPLNVEALSALGLSRRESEVLAWVAQGKTNSEIAAALGINLGTVKKHLVHIFHKLRVETRTAAAALAYRTHFPSPEDGR